MITRLTKHDTHQVSVHKCKPDSKHYAALRCADCDVHIQWLNNQEAEKINRLLNPNTHFMGIGMGGDW